MKYVLSIAFLFIIAVCSAQKTVLSKIPLQGKSQEIFIPRGFDTIMTASGDLNKDNLDDLVLVLRSKIEETFDPASDTLDTIPSRVLVVLFKTATGFDLVAATDHALLCHDCGGMMGDPFTNIEIRKGVITIDHFGGSSWRWSYSHKFRYQQNDIYLIGETSSSFWIGDHCDALDEFPGTDFKDVNFITGAYEQKKVSQEGCKLLVNKKGKLKIRPLKKLTEFKIEN